MTDLIVPIILAGGQGTRLWPLSRSELPKQFLTLQGSASLYQDALRRADHPATYLPPLVVTNAEYRFIAIEQAADIGVGLGGVLLEPVSRNTAAAIAVAALHAFDRFGPDIVLQVLPSDHAVAVDDTYRGAVARAEEAARQGYLATFGMVPRFAETGYGYIKAGARLGDGFHAVDQFIEKPEIERAERMLEAGGFLWNSGMFMFRASTLLAECERLAPQTLAASRAALGAARADHGVIHLDPVGFSRAPNISVDFAVFEGTDKAAVVPADFSWFDMGSWAGVWKAGHKDEKASVAVGGVTLNDVSNSLVISDHAHVVVDGMEDVAVIANADAVYVGRLSQSGRVGSLVEALKARPETTGLTAAHPTAYRPWGGYASVVDGERFQVKRLFVKPGKRLSLQKHHHRAEHWIVVRGTAEVTVDGVVTLVGENQSVYLPAGSVHRLANPGKIELEVIEVQTGSYLGEDDIVRLEDEFGRS